MFADTIVARARALVGTPFRAQGRDADGFDCVGLVTAALDRGEDAPADYPLRCGVPARVAAGLAAAGLRQVGDPSAGSAGDVLVMRAGPGQLHLGIWTGAGLIHADAGLRRVVERPGAVPWPVVGVWRVHDGE